LIECQYAPNTKYFNCTDLIQTQVDKYTVAKLRYMINIVLLYAEHFYGIITLEKDAFSGHCKPPDL